MNIGDRIQLRELAKYHKDEAKQFAGYSFGTFYHTAEKQHLEWAEAIERVLSVPDNPIGE